MTFYSIKDHDVLIDTEPNQKSYVLKIKDLPKDEQPREKLIRYGPAALSVVELLAIILNTGSKQENVLALSRRVIKDYGEKALIYQRNVDKISKDLHMPQGKAAQIVACAELGRRFFDKESHGLPIVRTAKDVYNYLREMQNLPKEHLRGLYLNSHFQVIHDEVISIGTINANIIHPREVFRPAIEYGAVALILAHNHPSGITTPSDADIEVTKQLVAVGKVLGIDLLDHLIISKGMFISIDIKYV
jgi:DNA repair protein RadC